MQNTRISLLHRVFFPTGWGTPSDRKNWFWVMGLSSTFAFSWALITYLISAGYVPPGAPALAVTSVPILVALGLMGAYYRFLCETDELQRLVQVNALALGFGAGMFWSVFSSMLARAGAATPDSMSVPLIMVCAYCVGAAITAHRHGTMA
jgi:hypothetical protein